MILSRLLTLAHCAAHAVRSRVDCTVNLGSAYDPEDRGIAVTALGVHLQIDRDGVMVLRAGCVEHDHDEPVGSPNPDGAETVIRCVTDDTIESWLIRARDGEDTGDLMREIELAEVEQAVHP